MTGITQKRKFSAAELQDWLINYLAQYLQVPPEKIDINLPFDCYGLDSAVTIGMTGELESLLDCTLDPTVVYDYPTIGRLAQHLNSSSDFTWRKNLHR